MDRSINFKCEIDLPNGYKLVAERDDDGTHPYEMYVGILDQDGVWYQDLVIVEAGQFGVPFIPDEDMKFNICVFGDENREDATEVFQVGLYKDENGLMF